MDCEVDAVDLESLCSGLEDEPGFNLADLLGAKDLAAMLASGEIRFDVPRLDRFHGFGTCVEVISVYLSEYVSGIEVVEELDASARRTAVRCWRYVGRRGELVKVPLEHAISLTREVLPGREDVAALRAMWPELPQWARDAYKLSFDGLADLDSGVR
jgi:hypothetical protein